MSNILFPGFKPLGAPVFHVKLCGTSPGNLHPIPLILNTPEIGAQHEKIQTKPVGLDGSRGDTIGVMDVIGLFLQTISG